MRQAKPRSRTPTHLPCCSAPLNSATASRRCLFPALSAATHLRVGRKPRLRPCGSVNKCAHIARYGSRRRRPPAPAGLERRGRRLLARRRRWRAATTRARHGRRRPTARGSRGRRRCALERAIWCREKDGVRGIKRRAPGSRTRGVRNSGCRPRRPLARGHSHCPLKQSLAPAYPCRSCSCRQAGFLRLESPWAPRQQAGQPAAGWSTPPPGP